MRQDAGPERPAPQAGVSGTAEPAAPAWSFAQLVPIPAPTKKDDSSGTAANTSCPGDDQVQSGVGRPAPQPEYTCRFCLRRDKQMSMVLPCNCKDDSSRAHANCVVLQASQNKVPRCHICRCEFAIRIDSRKTFVDWLKDRDHLADHVKFALSVFFTFNTVLMLTFAWMYAGKTMPRVSRFLSVPVTVALLFQSFTWLSLAFFMLWLYRMAYLHWKTATSAVEQRAPDIHGSHLR